jgi:hypothetical protein
LHYVGLHPHPFYNWSVNRLRPILFTLTVIIALLIMSREAATSRPVLAVGTSADSIEYLEYSTVPGYFQQDDLATDDKSFDYV